MTRKTMIAAAALAALSFGAPAGAVPGHPGGGFHAHFTGGPFAAPSFRPIAPAGFRGRTSRFGGPIMARGRFDRPFGRRGPLTLENWGWPGYWGGIYYGGGAAAPPAPADEVADAPVAPPAPPICPELIRWSPKLGHAVRQRLCADRAD
jgi:hypothetical protein